ncbi:MAG: hypothetical protein CL577_01900 [Alteromonadaceae bacterium]|nr:hypothetical protein [Alteromonadaceae bacterium]
MILTHEEYQQLKVPHDQKLFETYHRELESAKNAFAKKDDKALKKVYKTVRQFYKRLDSQIQKSTVSKNINFACDKGCNHCCQIRVEVFGYEVSAINEFIRKTFSNDEISHLMSKLAVVSAKAKGLRLESHFIPCAFLKDGECSIYEMRPAMCRKYYSVSLDGCLNKNQGVEHKVVKEMSFAMISGFSEGARQAGLRKTVYEFNQAIHKALSDPATVKHWLSGVEQFIPIPEITNQ